MAEIKTKPTSVSVKEFISNIPNENVRKDCAELVKIMQKITGKKPVMWGPTIVGFDKYRYQYETGHLGEICVAGFAPRGNQTVLYVMGGMSPESEVFKRLGKHKAGKSCLYIKRLSDVDKKVLEEIITSSVKWVKDTWG